MWFPYVSMQTMTLIMHGYMSGYTWWTWRWCLVMPFQMYGIYRNQALPKRETCPVPWNDENVFGDPDSCSLVESRPGFEGLLNGLVGSAVFSTMILWYWMILIFYDHLTLCASKSKPALNVIAIFARTRGYWKAKQTEMLYFWLAKRKLGFASEDLSRGLTRKNLTIRYSQHWVSIKESVQVGTDS